MTLTMQVKLLRVIQERKVVRVGGETPIPVDMRIICATHQDLQKMVEAGEFREDLYYRIHVVDVRIPPLRERKEDILWIARRLLETGSSQRGATKFSITPAAERALTDYPWPGNIRELKHCLERASILSNQAALTPEFLFDEMPMGADTGGNESLGEYLQDCEPRYIDQALRANEGCIAETAASLGISRKNLWEKMKKLNMQSNSGNQ